MVIVIIRIICEDNEDGDDYIDRSPRRLAAKLIRETPTMTKSSQHHALPKYATHPMANSLRHVSRKNTTVRIRSR